MNKPTKKKIEKIQKLVDQLDVVTKQIMSFKKTLGNDGVIVNDWLDKYLAETRKLVNALTSRIKFITIYEQ